ncbi:MAG: hypothetical protein ABIR47_16865 [Candidatus Kapaibacterium sp.]
MLETERLVLNPRRRIRYYAPSIGNIVVAIWVTGIIIFLFSKARLPALFYLLGLIMPLLTVYTCVRQSFALQLKSLTTRLSKRENREIARKVVDELGWSLQQHSDDYIEAITVFDRVPAVRSQLIAIVIADQRILMTSISQPDYGNVQVILTLGQNEKNVDRFMAMVTSLSRSPIEEDVVGR